ALVSMADPVPTSPPRTATAYALAVAEDWNDSRRVSRARITDGVTNDALRSSPSMHEACLGTVAVRAAGPGTLARRRAAGDGGHQDLGLPLRGRMLSGELVNRGMLGRERVAGHWRRRGRFARKLCRRAGQLRPRLQHPAPFHHA